MGGVICGVPAGVAAWERCGVSVAGVALVSAGEWVFSPLVANACSVLTGAWVSRSLLVSLTSVSFVTYLLIGPDAFGAAVASGFPAVAIGPESASCLISLSCVGVLLGVATGALAILGGLGLALVGAMIVLVGTALATTADAIGVAAWGALAAGTVPIAFAAGVGHATTGTVAGFVCSTLQTGLAPLQGVTGADLQAVVIFALLAAFAFLSGASCSGSILLRFVEGRGGGVGVSKSTSVTRVKDDGVLLRQGVIVLKWQNVIYIYNLNYANAICNKLCVT